MRTHARANAVIGAAIIAWATLAAAHAVAAPDAPAIRESGAPHKTQATPTALPAPIGDDLIYDFVGPNASDGRKVTGR